MKKATYSKTLRFWSLLFAASLAVASLAGCGNAANDSSNTNSGSTSTVSTADNDKSSDDSSKSDSGSEETTETVTIKGITDLSKHTSCTVFCRVANKRTRCSAEAGCVQLEILKAGKIALLHELQPHPKPRIRIKIVRARVRLPAVSSRKALNEFQKFDKAVFTCPVRDYKDAEIIDLRYCHLKILIQVTTLHMLMITQNGEKYKLKSTSFSPLIL